MQDLDNLDDLDEAFDFVVSPEIYKQMQGQIRDEELFEDTQNKI